MTTKMHDALINEIAFIFDVLEHEDINSLYTIDTISEAADQAEGYASAWGDELPEGLNDPATMMMVWNYCIESIRKDAEQRKAQEEDDRFANEHPDWLRFKGVYDNGDQPAGSCFFDLENLIADIKVYLHYDQQHCDIIRKAMLAYAKH